VTSIVVSEQIEPGVQLITLNRPDTLNAMSMALVQELRSALEAISADSSCRAVVLTGAGRGFCSGHDLAEMRDLGSAVDGLEVQQAFAGLITRVRSIRQPVIAAVNGAAAGGGLALALAADTRVCSESARFNAAFVRIGLSGCDIGVSYLLPRIVGPTLAFEMMLTGRLVDAREALASRLVLRVVPDGTVVEAALEIARSLRENTPLGVQLTKQVMWANLDASSLENAITLENSTQILCVQTPGHREALSAFAQRLAERSRSRS
jgi:enoyl-CoA hydratase